MMSTFLLSCDNGLEFITMREVRKHFPNAVVSRFHNFSRRVRVVLDAPAAVFFKLRSIHEVIEIREEIRLEVCSLEALQQQVNPEHFPELARAASFRVTSDRWGNHPFRTMDMQAAIGSRLLEAYSLPVDLDNYAVNVRVDLLGSRGFVGIQHTRQPLSKRGGQRPFYHKAGLKASVAFAMLELADLQPGQTLLDPMCGGGTILLEAADYWGERLRLLGGEKVTTIAAGALQNTAGLPITIHSEADARRVDKHFPERIDRIVSNVPYGIQSGHSGRLRGLYDQFLMSSSRVMPAESRMVLLTARQEILRNVILRIKVFKIIEEVVIESGGLYPHIFVLEKIA